MSLTIIYPREPIECIRNFLHRLREESVRVANLVLEHFNRQLDKLFLEMCGAETLAQRVASCWAVRAHVEYMVHIGDSPKVPLLYECDRFINKALRALIRVDPEGFDMLEDAANLPPRGLPFGSDQLLVTSITDERLS